MDPGDGLSDPESIPPGNAWRNDPRFIAEVWRSYGPEGFYRRFGRVWSEQQVYGLMRRLFGISFKEFRAIAARVNPAERSAAPDQPRE